MHFRIKVQGVFFRKSLLCCMLVCSAASYPASAPHFARVASRRPVASFLLFSLVHVTRVVLKIILSSIALRPSFTAASVTEIERKPFLPLLPTALRGAALYTQC